MTGKQCVVVLDGAEKQGSYPAGMEVIGLEFNILEQPVHFRIGVTGEQMKLADIIPLARAVSAKITRMVVKEVCGRGDTVPCSRGCSACCNYLVPLSVPEAFRLREEILEMPEDRQGLVQLSCLMAAKHISQHPLTEKFVGRTAEAPSEGPGELNLVSSWYEGLKLACPFHYKGECTIYGHRPLACREHFVMGSASACGGGYGTAELVDMPLRMVDTLGRLASELEGTEVEAIMLPFVPIWCGKNLHRAQRTWPAVEMVKKFFEIIETSAATEDIVSSAAVGLM